MSGLRKIIVCKKFLGTVNVDLGLVRLHAEGAHQTQVNILPTNFCQACMHHINKVSPMDICLVSAYNHLPQNIFGLHLLTFVWLACAQYELTKLKSTLCSQYLVRLACIAWKSLFHNTMFYIEEVKTGFVYNLYMSIPMHHPKKKNILLSKVLSLPSIPWQWWPQLIYNTINSYISVSYVSIEYTPI